MTENNFCCFSKEVKRRLVDIEQSQTWLAQMVSKDTGLEVDDAYLSNILSGRRKSEKIISSIKKILKIEERVG